MWRLFVAAIKTMPSKINFLDFYPKNFASIVSKKERGNWLRLTILR
jgi:hypothetical protein